MNSQSEVGISPVLLQAISQTLSNKAGQQQVVAETQSPATIHDSTSVPVATEQIIVSQQLDEAEKETSSNIPQDTQETIIQEMNDGSTLMIVQNVDSLENTGIQLKQERSDNSEEGQCDLSNKSVQSPSHEIVIKNVVPTSAAEQRSAAPIEIQLPQHVQQSIIQQQLLQQGDFQMGSVLSAIATHLSKARKPSVDQQVLEIHHPREETSSNAPIIVSVQAGATSSDTVLSSGHDLTVSDVENVTAEQVIQNVSSSSDSNPIPAAKRTRIEVADSSQERNGPVYIRADSLPPGTVLHSIETENGIIHVTQVSTVDSSRPTGALTEIYGPCPICGDRISGYHYGIYSCESCKGFFKRTVQNKKTFMCHRKGECEVNVSNRKKCPACRFKRCLIAGMKLEAIRTDRTRGGRSSYDGCSPAPRLSLPNTPKTPGTKPVKRKIIVPPLPQTSKGEGQDGNEQVVVLNMNKDEDSSDDAQVVPQTPQILEDLLTVESLMTEEEEEQTCCEGKFREGDTDLFASLLHIADHCLYKIVRWARSLPDFSNVSTDDQVLLLENCWLELLFISVSWNSIRAENELALSHGRTMNAELGKAMGFEEVTQRLIDFTDLIKRLEVDTYEFVALKFLILMSPDVKGLKYAGVLKDYQDKIAESLLVYSVTHYPQHLNKHAELLSRLPELTRTCNLAKEMLCNRRAAGEVPQYSLLSELLKGDISVQQPPAPE